MGSFAPSGRNQRLLVVHNEGEKRSYKIEIAPPIGKSFASDIARKYGVTYEMLTEDKLV